MYIEQTRFPKSETIYSSGARWYEYEDVRDIFEIGNIKLKNSQLRDCEPEKIASGEY
jgi:hypothetical protein